MSWKEQQIIRQSLPFSLLVIDFDVITCLQIHYVYTLVKTRILIPIINFFFLMFCLFLSVCKILSSNLSATLLSFAQFCMIWIHRIHWYHSLIQTNNRETIMKLKIQTLMSSLAGVLHILLSLLKSILESVESKLQVLVSVASENHSEPASLLSEEGLTLYINH